MVAKLPGIEILVEGDKILLNPYAVIVVNPQKFPTRNSTDATIFANWLMSDEGQNLIASYKIGDQQLFIPLHGNCMT
jgi:tungstate transport system substrate-binding protein